MVVSVARCHGMGQCVEGLFAQTCCTVRRPPGCKVRAQPSIVTRYDVVVGGIEDGGSIGGCEKREMKLGEERRKRKEERGKRNAGTAAGR